MPCCEIDWLRTDDCMWICFVHQLFKVGQPPGSFDRRRLIDVLCCTPKTLDLFHECGIAHLDMCVPAHDDAAQVYSFPRVNSQAGNVLYDTKTARISVIDWHGVSGVASEMYSAFLILCGVHSVRHTIPSQACADRRYLRTPSYQSCSTAHLIHGKPTFGVWARCLSSYGRFQKTTWLPFYAS